MSDVVVTLPKSFGLDAWMDEGDRPGESWSGAYYYWRLGRNTPKIEPGERVCVCYDGKLIGYSPLVAIRYDREGTVYLVRGGGAVSCTIDEEIPGFRGYRYVWWRRDEERSISGGLHE